VNAGNDTVTAHTSKVTADLSDNAWL
jgi:hypothetical protein